MKRLLIDAETFSAVHIYATGMHKYALDPSFRVLLLGYAYDDNPVCIVDIAHGETLPEDVRQALLGREDTLVYAFNAAFEWFCLSRWLGVTLPIDRFRCVMAHGLSMGYPAGLEKMGAALGLPEDKKKLAAGRALIKRFCAPEGAVDRKGKPRGEDPAKWALFKEYCARDVESEREIERLLGSHPMPRAEQRLWERDCLMNALGIPVDAELAKAALSMARSEQDALTDEAIRVSGIDNPRSIKQLMAYASEHGDTLPDLRKATVAEALTSGDVSEETRRMLTARQMLGKTSNSKYEAIESCLCEDNRVRGVSRYAGAPRTSRYSGLLIQVQNLPRTHLHSLDWARETLRRGGAEGLRLMYGNIPDTLSQLIRTMFVPSRGRTLVVADYSSIEARVVAWLAGEHRVMNVFAGDGRIYEATAAAMFGVPVESIVPGRPEYELRGRGKVAALALGYQGGVKALINMGALEMGLTEEELPDIVGKWRSANQAIVRLWREVEDAALHAVQTGETVRIGGQGRGRLTLALERGVGRRYLTIRLPSGRKLFYENPFISDGRFGNEAVHYYDSDQSGKWRSEQTYGGKIVEQCTQATARDCLCVLLSRLWDEGFDVLFHVHDEVVIDGREGDLARVLELMERPIDWAYGLVLRGSGYESAYYKKA